MLLYAWCTCATTLTNWQLLHITDVLNTRRQMSPVIHTTSDLPRIEMSSGRSCAGHVIDSARETQWYSHGSVYRDTETISDILKNRSQNPSVLDKPKIPKTAEENCKYRTFQYSRNAIAVGLNLLKWLKVIAMQCIACSQALHYCIVAIFSKQANFTSLS